eukprot:gene952-1034_t
MAWLQSEVMGWDGLGWPSRLWEGLGGGSGGDLSAFAFVHRLEVLSRFWFKNSACPQREVVEKELKVMQAADASLLAALFWRARFKHRIF